MGESKSTELLSRADGIQMQPVCLWSPPLNLFDLVGFLWDELKHYEKHSGHCCTHREPRWMVRVSCDNSQGFPGNLWGLGSPVLETGTFYHLQRSVPVSHTCFRAVIVSCHLCS